MKFALAGYGSRGDIEPFAAVGRELLRRGHGVAMAVTPNMIGFVESAGLAAAAFGPDPPQHKDFSHTTLQNPILMMSAFTDQIRAAWAQWAASLLALADGADLVLTGKSEQGLAANVAQHHGIARAALHFFPDGAAGPNDMLARLAAEAEAAQRGELGLAEVDGSAALEIQAYDTLCFPGLAAQWAEQGLRRPFVGALTLELPANADAEAGSWIEAGTPPIYFGFGSGVRVTSADTVAVIAQACAQLGERALICSGPNDFTAVPLFDHVKVVGEVNHASVFPACRAVVHHGGAGTTAAGLRAGIPALILSLGVDDQQVWAATVQRLKVGVGQEFRTTTLDSLVADLRCILAPEYATRARAIAALMATPAESIARAADLLEEAARAGR
ncbi:glycosyltransferase [Mycobacterium florentinum]|uniref:Glycosyltransferase n=1 Tax=Mycobacterium florentinum TaxID=292462 RepID=A0A1X1TUW4_MYCFL|nr:glycosyltransferase [Mycobacterium florentinum]MCV7408798.1 glycosyltransferase [Mycobacterium florentinum]ORV48374.1 glycosyltransferase [Mycobacterium florentinum]BBX77592.1 putative glycosyltransferase [Mycobacterium florentinum]